MKKPKNNKIIIGVYKIKNIKTGKWYVGYTKDIYKRFEQHKTTLENNTHQNIILQRSYNKHGIDNFTFEIIHEYNTIDEAKK